MTTGAWIAVAAVVLTVGLGLWRNATDGRFRPRRAVGAAAAPGAGDSPAPAHLREVEHGKDPDDVAAPPPADVPPGADVAAVVGQQLGERATLLQFSSAFCAPCRATRRVLEDVSRLVPGVTHVEVDAEQHLDATRAFGILRTPTTLVLDGSGAEVTRATGAPTRDQVLTALARVPSQDPDASTTS
ncbi:thioredoxin family protein [Nocardioides xinjiangensis]|uniref:thioredoxin family protein n=1 Tax=Nocardioides xinjiangensis TaxID=2817376 RepID=UPI001B3123B6|nr:thioredoxin family protein [Nocardioides sp. SYSU D00778]